jgi:hypothetical protein
MPVFKLHRTVLGSCAAYRCNLAPRTAKESESSDRGAGVAAKEVLSVEFWALKAYNEFGDKA